MPKQSILILDFGGQYNQLIARRVRECNVYCEVKPYTMTMEEIRAFDPMGIIFTGGPNSVYDAKSPQVNPEVFTLGVPSSASATAVSSSPTIWAAGSPPPPTTPPGSTAKPRRISTHPAGSSRVCPPRASPG